MGTHRRLVPSRLPKIPLPLTLTTVCCPSMIWSPTVLYILSTAWFFALVSADPSNLQSPLSSCILTVQSTVAQVEDPRTLITFGMPAQFRSQTRKGVSEAEFRRYLQPICHFRPTGESSHGTPLKHGPRMRTHGTHRSRAGAPPTCLRISETASTPLVLVFFLTHTEHRS